MREAGRDGRAGDRVHARGRDRVRAGGDRRGAARSTTSRRGCRSSSRATSTSSRRSRSSARHGACGRGSCASGSAREDERSLTLRFHTQTGGATLTAQQPREQHRADGARGAVGRARRHPVAPHERVRRGAGAPDRALREDRAADPAGDRLRDRRGRGGRSARRARTTWRRSPTSSSGSPTAYIEKVDGMGGAVAAIEQGFYQDEIHEAAFRIQQAIERGDRVVVGREPVPGRRGARARAAADRRGRGRAAGRPGAGAPGLAGPGGGRRRARRGGATARGDGNLLPPMKEALRARATLGEVSDVLRDVFGEYRPSVLNEPTRRPRCDRDHAGEREHQTRSPRNSVGASRPTRPGDRDTCGANEPFDHRGHPGHGAAG